MTTSYHFKIARFALFSVLCSGAAWTFVLTPFLNSAVSIDPLRMAEACDPHVGNFADNPVTWLRHVMLTAY